MLPPILPRNRRGGGGGIGGGGMRRTAGESGVVKTNDDAQATKLSCASLGYFSDAVLPLLHKGGGSGGSAAGTTISSGAARKPPIINRGTWARHAVMRQVTHDFVTACSTLSSSNSNGGVESGVGGGPSSSSSPDPPAGAAETSPSSDNSSIIPSSQLTPVCQVVALGAGTDSSWFNLRHQGWHLLRTAHFIEVDFQEVVSKKARTVLSTPQLLQLLPPGTTAVTAAPGAAAAAAGGGGGGALSPPSPVAAGSSHTPPAHITWTKPHATPAAGAGASQQNQQQQEKQEQPGAAGASPACSQAQTHPQQQQHHHYDDTSSAQPPPAVLHHVQQLSGPHYSLVAADLRDMQQFKSALSQAGFNPQLPTLYLAECVLIYLEPSEAEAVLATTAALAAEAGAPAAIAIYEQTRPDDAFGSTMIHNLEARGCPLRSVLSVPTPAAQAQRLNNTGWTAAAAAADMAAIYYGNAGSNKSNGNNNNSRVGMPLAASAGPAMSPPAAAAASGSSGSSSSSGWLRPWWQAERVRIERLELLDELEEWRLLQEHYCLALGVLGDATPDGSHAGWLSEALQLQQLAALMK